jgi:hypothetical protein
MTDAVNQKWVKDMAGCYPKQAGWLKASLASTLERVDRVLNVLPAKECNDVARTRLHELRDLIAADKALFDAIHAEEFGS